MLISFLLLIPNKCFFKKQYLKTKSLIKLFNKQCLSKISKINAIFKLKLSRYSSPNFAKSLNVLDKKKHFDQIF